MTTVPKTPYRLAPRTSSQECLPSMQNSLKTKFNRIPERLDCRPPTQLFATLHHLRRRWQPPNHLADHQTALIDPIRRSRAMVKSALTISLY